MTTVLGVLGWLLGTVVALFGMGAAALRVAALPGPPSPYLVWLGVSAGVCALGALLLASQPIGRATLLGRIGAIFLRWGFGAGQGRLFLAVVISTLVWVVYGSAVIFASARPIRTERVLVSVAWAVDALALMYMIGVPLKAKSPRIARGLAPVALCLAGMLAVSAFLWNGGPASQHTALVVAGGPTLFVAGGYGVFLGAMLVFGRNTRWN